MASQQATTTRIRTADFQGNRISFPVESVLGIGQGTGELIIDASAGYLLITPTNTNPQTQQTIPYVLQPNGTHLAHAVITVLASGLPFVNGTVTLRNPLGETTMLPIDDDTDTGLMASMPVLILSAETLTFAKTETGESEYAILKVSQQGANTLVTLTSDDPAYFLIATATGVEELRFTSTVSFMPLPAGTFVHVRYAPERSGKHTARLFVETSFDTKTVLLRGRAAGLLAALPRRPAKVKRANQSVRSEQSPGVGRWLPISVILLLGGLAWAGYFYRCQLAPGLCRDEPLTMPFTRTDKLPGNITPDKSVEKPLTATGKQNEDDNEPAVSEVTRSEPKRKKSSSQTDAKTSKRSRDESQERSERIETRSSVTPKKNEPGTAEPVTGKRKVPVQPAVPNPTGESDLEKALNKKSDKPL